MKRSNLVSTLFLIVLALVSIIIASSVNTVDADRQHKVVVCKYVTTPGEGEVLQTGQNPIVADYHSIPGFNPDNPGFPYSWGDEQGKSIAIRWAQNSHDGDISECPGYEEPTPTPTNTATPTNTPEEPTPTNTPEGPTPTPTNTPEGPTPTPTRTPKHPTPTPPSTPPYTGID